MNELVNNGISVIVPVYNADKYLKSSIESVLSQTFDNFELILIDDGSTDKSGEICDLYAEKDSRVRVIHKENGGGSLARKIGIDAAIGKYIMFMDSDDAFTKDAFEKAHQAITKENVDIVQFGYSKTDSIESPMPAGTGDVQLFEGRDALLQIMTKKSPNLFSNLLWCKIYKSEIVKKPQYNTSIRTNNDVPVIARVFYYAERVAALDYSLYYYVQRKDDNNQSITDELLKSREKFIRSHLRSFTDVANFFKDKDEEMYKASLKNLIAMALSAIKEKGLSKVGKKEAVWVIKQHKVIGNRFIPFKKRLVAVMIKLVGVFINTKSHKI